MIRGQGNGGTASVTLQIGPARPNVSYSSVDWELDRRPVDKATVVSRAVDGADKGGTAGVRGEGRGQGRGGQEKRGLDFSATPRQ